MNKIQSCQNCKIMYLQNTNENELEQTCLKHEICDKCSLQPRSSKYVPIYDTILFDNTDHVVETTDATEQKLIKEGFCGHCGRDIKKKFGSCPTLCDCGEFVCPKCGGKLDDDDKDDDTLTYCGCGCSRCGWSHCGGCI